MLSWGWTACLSRAAFALGLSDARGAQSATMLPAPNVRARVCMDAARSLTAWWVVVLGAWLLGSEARAQSTETVAMDVQHFRPAPGPLLGASVADPRPLKHLELSLGLSANYAYDLVPQAGWAGDYGLSDLGTAELSVALGLYDHVEVGLSLPLSAASQSARDRAVVERDQVALGDLRASAKVGLLRGPLDLALVVDGLFPTASEGYPFGDPMWRLRPALVGVWNRGPARVGLSAGFEFRRTRSLTRLQVGRALRLSPVVEVRLATPLTAFVEGQLQLATVRGASAASSEAEVLLGFVLRLGRLGELRVGGGSGQLLLPDGYAAPAFRTFAELRLVAPLRPCKHPVEDFDGFEDEDGCADEDNDRDGVPDVADRCPDVAEDRDGFMDGDGCPDWDDDADGIVDRLDRCPRLTEDRDGFEDEDGCPEPDNDEDGVPDGFDACAMEPEDRDDFQDGDGCPEPGPKASAVVVAEDRILVSESIYFEHDRDVIRAVSLPLLEQVARTIADLPQLTRVRIVGHTDDAGNPEYNLDLSYRRARAVSEFLKSRGIPESRLLYEGRGGRDPVAPNDSPAGRALNRRVEFQILRPARAP